MPLSIATPDRERREATKSKLIDVVLKKTRNPPKPPKSVIAIKKQKPSVLVVDLIAVIRTMTELPQTYYEFTWKFFGSLPKGYKRVDLAANTYIERDFNQEWRAPKTRNVSPFDDSFPSI